MGTLRLASFLPLLFLVLPRPLHAFPDHHGLRVVHSGHGGYYGHGRAAYHYEPLFVGDDHDDGHESEEDHDGYHYEPPHHESEEDHDDDHYGHSHESEEDHGGYHYEPPHHDSDEDHYDHSHESEEDHGGYHYEPPHHESDEDHYDHSHESEEDHGGYHYEPPHHDSVEDHDEDHYDHSHESEEDHDDDHAGYHSFTPILVAHPQSYHQSESEGWVGEYENKWRVKEDSARLDFGQNEEAHDSTVDGSYYVLLPDGRKQTVTYHVGEDGKYNAYVTYQQVFTPAAPPPPPTPYKRPEEPKSIYGSPSPLPQHQIYELDVRSSH